MFLKTSEITTIDTLFSQGTIVHVPTGNCIDRGTEENSDKPIMMACDGRQSQEWKFGFYNSTVFIDK